MKIELAAIDLLTEDEVNTKVHTEKHVQHVAASIKEFGWTKPIVVNAEYMILAGHARYYAAQKLNLKKVPVLKLSGLTKEKESALNIIDNKLGSDSALNIHNLEIKYSFLEDSDFPMEEFGIEDLKSVIAGFEVEEIETGSNDADDYEPEEQKQIYIKAGDLIELGKHRVLCGDSTNPEHIKELLNGQQPILMVTDPPYGVEYDPSWRKKAGVFHNRAKMGAVQNDDRTDWGDAYRLIDAQVAYVWHNGRYAKEFQLSLEAAGYKIICQIIWNKERFALGRGDYHWKHEPCWYAVKEGKTHNWQGARDQSTIWDINAREDSGHGHGTQKPIECMARPIINNTERGDLVSDPFLGSGTTLIACEQLGRICYGLEIEPKYCQVIIDRYKKFCLDQDLFFDCKINGVTFKELNDE